MERKSYKNFKKRIIKDLMKILKGRKITTKEFTLMEIKDTLKELKKWRGILH